MAETSTIGINPMHKRPESGRRIVVALNDGRQIECRTCMVVSARGSGIVIYHKRNALDESKAVGWWPVRRSPQ